MLRTSLRAGLFAGLMVALPLIPAPGAAQTDPHSPEAAVQSMRAPDPVKSTAPGGPRVAHPTGDVSIGEVAPGFTLDDQEGRQFKLATERGTWVALCFGDRRTVLAMVDSTTHALTRLNVRVAAVVHENGQALRAYCAKNALHVRALADHSGEVCMIYGLWDGTREQALTGMVLVDPQGIIRARETGAHLSAQALTASVRSAMPGL